MAISGISGYGSNGSYRDQWENRDLLDDDEEVEGSSSSGRVWNAVFTDKKENSVSVDDFLTLMVAQMTNQDFMNPMDDTQFVTQLAQFSSMQMMQEMANYTKTSYVMSLVGKPVTAAKITVAGNLEKETGPVERISLTNNEFAIYVNGKRFTLEQIMEIGTKGEDSASGTTGATDTDGTAKPTDTTSTVDNSYRKTYLLSLIGKTVTVTKKVDTEDGKGTTLEATGKVEKVSSKDDIYRVCVGGEWFSLDAVTEVGGEVTDSVDTSEETENPENGSETEEKPLEEAEEV